MTEPDVPDLTETELAEIQAEAHREDEFWEVQAFGRSRQSVSLPSCTLMEVSLWEPLLVSAEDWSLGECGSFEVEEDG
jgi:hypothetical protein